MKHFTLLVMFLVGGVCHSKTLYILGIDGLSHESYRTAQKMGYFKDLKSASAHIAPFPSMTDLAWNEFTQAKDLFGSAGRIHSVEATYFNESTKAVEGDFRDYYRRLAQPKYYLNAFQNAFNPYVEALMYFPTQELPKKEIQTVFEGMLATKNKDLVTGYIGAIDSMAHTQQDRLYPVIKVLDEQIKLFLAKLRESGQDFELIIVSDHGNVGTFQEGEKEEKLIPVEIKPALLNAGLKFVAKLEDDNDVAMPLMALGSWAPVYVKNKSSIPKIVNEMVRHDWFDLAVELKESSAARVVLRVTGANGEAHVIYNKQTNLFDYELIQGNPLEFNPADGRMTQLTVQAIEATSRKGRYPDSIIRLVESVLTDQFDYPHLILTFKDGYYLNNSLSEMTSMFRTHGSLTKAASLGVLASTSRRLPEFLRSRQILPFLGLKPVDLFGEIGENELKSRNQIINEIKADRSKGIPTGARQFGDKKIFQLITKFVSLSRSFFVVDEIKQLVSAFNFSANSQQGVSVQKFDFSKLDTKTLIDPTEIGRLTDMVIQNPDIEQLKQSPEVKNLLGKMGVNVDLSSGSGNADQYRAQTLAAKRSVMKIYQVPYLLDQALTFQERPFLAEVRDLDFAAYWNTNRDKVNSDYSFLMKQYESNLAFWRQSSKESFVARLFREIWKEATIEDRIAPEPLKLIYNKAPTQTTVVYVPGTYNGIFDNEIFSLGLTTLKEELGLRVIKAPVFSACASDVNGAALNKFLEEDYLSFVERKQTPPKYVILGYSKGAVDSLHALVQNKKFAAANISGLVAIASPLKGSIVLEKADLPFFLVNLLIDENTPEICKKEKPATQSVSTQGMSSFWRKHERELVGLTRYFSISFATEPEDAHLYMKITKALAQFEEENDGIVSVSASQFPESLQPVDLGVIQADHLAGILSSRFNQKSFMRGLVRTLSELGLEDQKLDRTIRTRAILDVANTIGNQRLQFSPGNSNIITRTSYRQSNAVAASADRVTYDDPYELNQIYVSSHQDPLAFYESKIKLLPNQLAFDPFQTLDLAKMPDILASKKVTPATAQNFASGIDLSYNHTDVAFYRMDHQWMYESRSPVGGDNNADWGFQSVQGADKSQWLAMRSKNNSIRLTTLSYRFKASEFPYAEMGLNVTKSPKGADPVKGKSGKDDSAFQVWLTLRDLRTVSDRTIADKQNTKVYTFGYYWGEPVAGEDRPAGSIFENYYSNKNIVVAVFPPAFQLVLNSGDQELGKSLLHKRNLVQDLKKAYPDLDPEQLEVIGITLQMDSNDTTSQSEALLKVLRFMPKPNLDLDVKLPVNNK